MGRSDLDDMALVPLVAIDLRWNLTQGSRGPESTLQYRLGTDVLTVLTWGNWQDVPEVPGRDTFRPAMDGAR